ncbi:CinA family protein [Vibrio harveyi]|nr:CinA family protein [Vibrio harveyi]
MHNPSTILRQSYIGFSNSFKINVMGVNKNIIRRHGTHSVECAKNIAYNLKERSASDISICIIGNPIAPDINIEETLDGHSLLLFNFSLRIPLRTCYAVIVFPDDT